MRPLLFGSPAINTGNPTGCKDNLGNLLNTDQRGVARVGRCAIGAFEFDPNNNPIKQVFLPLIRTPRHRIFGLVTENGTPAVGVPLDLRFYDGANWSTRASTATAADGSYEFLNQPNLSAGQKYYVRYQNPGNLPNRLWVWGTRELTTYSGEEVNIGNFDLANIALVSPADSVGVSLPNTFQWTPRPASPTDTYEFDVYDPSDLDPYAYTNPLGYVGNFTLYSLPNGFATDTWCIWEIWVYSPDGGYGVSYESRWVYFTNAGAALQATEPLNKLTRPDDVHHPKIHHDLTPVPREVWQRKD